VESRRTYGDGCAIAHGLDLVGDRWALLVVRELLLGPKRFTDLKDGLPNASPNVISERLRELERDGVVKRVKLPPPANARVYELTEWGRELEQTVLALGRWAVRSPSLPAGVPVGLDSVVLAFKTLFDAGAANGLLASYELRVDEHLFVIEVSNGHFDVARGSPDQPNATIETDLGTLSAVIWGGRSLDDAQGAGQMRIEGDEAAVERLVGLFPLPEAAAAAAAR
jgi:DNA-binding HxlR family transcriptional regulator